MPCDSRYVPEQADGKTLLEAKERACVDLGVSLGGHVLRLRNVRVLVLDEDIPQMLLGKPLLNKLGVDVEAGLLDLAKEGLEIDCSSLEEQGEWTRD